MQRKTVFVFAHCSDSSNTFDQKIKNRVPTVTGTFCRVNNVYAIVFIISVMISLQGYGCYQFELDGATKALS